MLIADKMAVKTNKVPFHFSLLSGIVYMQTLCTFLFSHNSSVVAQLSSIEPHSMQQEGACENLIGYRGFDLKPLLFDLGDIILP